MNHDIQHVLDDIKYVYLGIPTEAFEYPILELYPFTDPMKSKLNSKNRHVQTDAMLDILSLKDALIAFYSRYTDSNHYSFNDNFSEGRILAYTALRDLDYCSETGTPSMRFAGIHFDSTFDFTSRSELTKGRISAIGYNDLKEVQAVKKAQQEEEARVRKKWASEKARK